MRERVTPVIAFVVWILVSHSATGFALSQTSKPTLLVPNTLQKFEPPRIIEDPNEDPIRSIYEFKIDCSDEVKSFFNFRPKGNFCRGLTFKGTAEDINNSLSQFLVSSASITSKQTASIVYQVRREKAASKPVTTLQTFGFETEMRIKLLKDVIVFDASKSKVINEHLISIDLRMVDFQDEFRFELGIDKQKIPDWMTFNINGYDLIIAAKPPSHFNENLSFMFSIIDHKSGLKSREVSLNLITVRNTELDNFFISFAVFFVSFCIIIVAGVVYCVINSANKPTDEYQYRNKYNELDSSVIKNVLSESITNWTNHPSNTKVSTSDSLSMRNKFDKSHYHNDSINELEALKDDLGNIEPVIAASNQTFIEEQNSTQIAEFGNISQIEHDREEAGQTVKSK